MTNFNVTYLLPVPLIPQLESALSYMVRCQVILNKVSVSNVRVIWDLFEKSLSNHNCIFLLMILSGSYITIKSKVFVSKKMYSDLESIYIYFLNNMVTSQTTVLIFNKFLVKIWDLNKIACKALILMSII